MENFLISVVTVCFNSERTISRTIESVLNQSYPIYEYLIVDGRSSDKTMDIVKEFEPLFNGKMKVISEADNGIYDAMNKGILMAKGKLIGILNSDDWYEPDTLENAYKHYTGNQYEVVYGMMKNYIEGKLYQIYMINHEFLFKAMITHSTCFVSLETYKDIGIYDVSYRSSADYDLFLKFYYDKRVKFTPVYKVMANFSLGGISSSTICGIENNKILLKYKIINKLTYEKNKVKYWLKNIFNV